MDYITEKYPVGVSLNMVYKMEGCHTRRALPMLEKLEAARILQTVPGHWFTLWTLTPEEAEKRGVALGEKTPSRTGKLSDRPNYIEVDSTPYRPGSNDAFELKSKRGEQFVDYRAPFALSCRKS